MSDLAAIDAELDVARKRDDNDARVRLIRRALALPAARPLLAGYLDELAYAYEQLGRFDEAVDAMRQALAAGWDRELDDYPSAEALIADLLLRAGRTHEADDAWHEAERRRPRDPWVHQAAGRAYARAGLRREALEWQTKGLELALQAGASRAISSGSSPRSGPSRWTCSAAPTTRCSRAARRSPRSRSARTVRTWGVASSPVGAAAGRPAGGVRGPRLVSGRAVRARAENVAELRRRLRAGILRGVLRAARAAAARAPGAGYRATRACADRDRRLPVVVRGA